MRTTHQNRRNFAVAFRRRSLTGLLLPEATHTQSLTGLSQPTLSKRKLVCERSIFSSTEGASPLDQRDAPASIWASSISACPARTLTYWRSAFDAAIIDKRGRAQRPAFRGTLLSSSSSCPFRPDRGPASTQDRAVRPFEETGYR